MRKQITKSLASAGLAAVFCLATAAGCASSLSAGSGGGGTPEPQENRIWSTYSTAKVIRDSDKNAAYVQGDARISVKQMKNEVEGTQLIVTAARDIGSYRLTVSDLSDGKGNTIPKENVAVYHQKYHELTSKRTTENTAYSIGDYIPDMLLPLEIAEAYGENKIAAGNNQGITIEFETTSETVPGVYTGSFELDLDGEKHEIPVSVEVWDIEYTGRRSMQSSFLVYQNQLLSGEYDNSAEVIRAYSDFLLKYKANALIWTGDIAAADVDAWMEEQKRLFEDDNYNSIYIPYYFTTNYSTYDSGGKLTSGAQTAFTHFDAIVKASMEKEEGGDYVNYVDYAYMYVIHLDEADIDDTKKAAAEKVFEEINKTYEAYLDKIQSDEDYLALKETDPEYAEELLESFGNITALFVNVDYIDEWVGNIDCTFCTYLSTFKDGFVADRYEAAAREKSNGDLWTYIANMSLYPTPSFLTDDYTLGMRVAGWMEKAYNIDGFLYWNASYYRVNGNAETWLNVYEDLDRASYISGDGFLLYPGRYYGSDSPFASLRLTTYRDSMDDYDMLCVYERLLKEHAAEYGIADLDFDAYVEDLYWSLFRGATYNTSDEALFAAREELASRILALQNDDKLLIRSEKSGAGTTVRIYAQTAGLTVNDESKTGTACGSGYMYTLGLDADAHDIKIVTQNNTYTYRVTATSAATLTGATVTCTEGSSATVEGGKANVTIKSVYRNNNQTIDGATLRFRPAVNVACGGFASAENLYFTIGNTGSEGFDARVEVVADGKVYELGTFYCAAGAEREVKLHIYDSLNLDASKITSVCISFQNVYTSGSGSQSLFADRTFELSDMFFDKK